MGGPNLAVHQNTREALNIRFQDTLQTGINIQD